MNTSKNAESTTTTTPAKDACCNIDIQIESKGDVNIYNCTTAPSPSGEPCPPPKDDHVCPPVAPGACVPASLGAKPKQSRRRKLDKLLANTRVPSALGASFFHMARRFLAGKTAANALEERAFAKLHRLAPDLRRVLACALDSFDSLSVGERDRLFASDLVRDVNQPITIAQLTDAFAQEIIDNVSVQVFDDPGCTTTEHPGQVRTPPFPGGEFPPAPVVVCRINGLRTGNFRPPLALSDYTPEELQQVCHVVLEGNQPKLVCDVQTTECPGNQVGGVCLRVQEIEAGKAVLLEGMNFSSVDTKVRLTDVATSTTVREVDAQVCGDDETPLTEIVVGKEVLITDCRVHDRLTFRVPDDLSPGLYEFQVMVPNVGGVPGWGDVLFSNGERINVVPSETARFQIASETLHCVDETSPAFFGSDEVGIKILAVPLFPDLTSGEAQSPNGGDPIRFDDVDSGETRGMDHLLFSHQQPIAGAALSIMGFEVDGEDAFKNQINSFTDAFIDILKDEIAFLKDHLKEVEAIAEKLAEKGLAGAIAAAVAIAVVLAIDVFVALWAPADLIIEDAIGPTTLDLVELTSVNFPLPLPTEHVTPQGIKVKVTPLEKTSSKYREKREYASDDEESRYEIVLRYNRLA
jgi:hypothetical protein